MKIKPVSAFAWECDFGLCKWAKPDKFSLCRDSKPSPEAKAVRVAIVPWSDYKKMAKVK